MNYSTCMRTGKSHASRIKHELTSDMEDKRADDKSDDKKLNEDSNLFQKMKEV